MLPSSSMYLQTYTNFVFKSDSYKHILCIKIFFFAYEHSSLLEHSYVTDIDISRYISNISICTSFAIGETSRLSR